MSTCSLSGVRLADAEHRKDLSRDYIGFSDLGVIYYRVSHRDFTGACRFGDMLALYVGLRASKHLRVPFWAATCRKDYSKLGSLVRSSVSRKLPLWFGGAVGFPWQISYHGAAVTHRKKQHLCK